MRNSLSQLITSFCHPPVKGGRGVSSFSRIKTPLSRRTSSTSPLNRGVIEPSQLITSPVSSVKISSCHPVKLGFGFTLVELMIVIAIIGVLAASLFPMISGYMARARDTTRATDLKRIELAVFSATNDKGGYLFSDTGQSSWCSSIGSAWRTSFEDRVRFYLTKVPHDPFYTSQVPLSDTGANVDYLYGEGRTATGLLVGTNGALASFALGAHFEGIPPTEYTGATWMTGPSGCCINATCTIRISQPYSGVKDKKF